METKEGKQYCYAVKLKCFTYNKSAFSTVYAAKCSKRKLFRIN